MKLQGLKRIFPSWQNALLAVLAAVLLILAFPDFDYWFLAWFALVPLMIAVMREKASTWRSFISGWIFGTVFFFGTCWWLTFAPITYAGIPPWLAYSGMVFVALIVGVFPALFAGILTVLLRKIGSSALLAAPFVWVFTEFLRYWIIGNNWNAIGYSQAFSREMIQFAAYGGVYLVGFAVVLFASFLFWSVERLFSRDHKAQTYLIIAAFWIVFAAVTVAIDRGSDPIANPTTSSAAIVALQPNVPMAGLDYTKWNVLRQHQVDMAEAELRKLSQQALANNQQRTTNTEQPTLVVMPESPMNYMYNDDREFQKYINDFTRRNNVSVLFNSAEPDKTNGKYFNSAMMIGADGKEVAEYDKIYLLPFGEAVPWPLEGILPGFVGNFSYGREYDLLPVGDAKAGVMICFESHFGQLSRRFVADGADVLIEMTNDGYLGPTPVIRQHLANAVFRAVETNRPVLRVTNVGTTAYITEKGEVLDPTSPYQEDTRVWSVSKSDGAQTFYVRYGDWFAWLCSAVTIGLLIYSWAKTKRKHER
ncbi:MAG: apolipoprotein N-acyltransferase [Pyrinomonadaceae bacterium]